MPTKVPPVFAGSRLLVYGFPKGERPAAVRLSAQGAAGALSFEVPLADARVTPGKSVSTLAARARIRELEESGEWLSTRGSRQTDRKKSSVSQEIIELSVRHGLISRETSFVAVERRETPVHGEVQLRRVPIALTSGWGGVREHMLALRGARMGAGARMLGGAPLDLADTQAFQSARMEERQGALGFSARLLRAWRPARDRAIPSPSEMYSLVALQKVDGHWELTNELAKVLGRELSELATAIAGASGDASDRRCAWATALAIVWLELHAPAAEEEWRLVVRKARKWIDDVEATPSGGWTWTDTARRFLAP
jgi:Ca-activated chloride channel family protein